MRLPFVEMLELEQRVALTAAIVRRLGEIGLLVDDAEGRDPVEVARHVVGVTNMEATERWAAINAAVSVGARALDVAAIVTSDWIAPTMRSLADNTGRVAERLSSRSKSRYVQVIATALPETTAKEVDGME